MYWYKVIEMINNQLIQDKNVTIYRNIQTHKLLQNE